MDSSPHPNLFPVARASVPVIEPIAQEPRKRGRPRKDSMRPPKPVIESAAPAEVRPTHGMRVFKHLSENGPARSIDICRALDMDVGSGIAPYVKHWIDSGRIVRFRDRRYAVKGTFDDSVVVRTLWQILTDLKQSSIGLREAYRLAKAHVRAAERQHPETTD